MCTELYEKACSQQQSLNAKLTKLSGVLNDSNIHLSKVHDGKEGPDIWCKKLPDIGESINESDDCQRLFSDFFDY